MTGPTRPPERVVAAVPTPFDAGGALDRAAFVDLLTELEPEVDAVLVAGTTGEFLALDDPERLALVADALDVLGADRTIAHVGAASAAQVQRLVEATADLGVTRLALLTPYYVPLDQPALLAWFTEVAGRVAGRELYAYLFAERTGVVAEPATVREVLALDGVAGLKVSGAAADRLRVWTDLARPGQSVWSGNDADLPGVLAAGGTGIVSGTSAAFPRMFGRLRRAAPDPTDDVPACVAAAGASLALLHAALAWRTGHPWATRLPGPAARPEQRDRLERLLSRSAPPGRPRPSTAGRRARGRGPTA